MGATTKSSVTTATPAAGTADAATAAGAYARHLRRVRAVLGCVEDALHAHERSARDRPQDWGPPGDLAEVENLAKPALVRLSGMDPGQLDRALDEMAAD